MKRVIDKLPRDVTLVVWEPHGLWETDDAAALAKKWGVILAVDAARDPVPEGQIAYVRLRALGETRSFGPSALERVVESIGPRRDAYVVLETTSALTECKTLRRIAQDWRNCFDPFNVRDYAKGEDAGFTDTHRQCPNCFEILPVRFV